MLSEMDGIFSDLQFVAQRLTIYNPKFNYHTPMRTCTRQMTGQISKQIRKMNNEHIIKIMLRTTHQYIKKIKNNKNDPIQPRKFQKQEWTSRKLRTFIADTSCLFFQHQQTSQQWLDCQNVGQVMQKKIMALIILSDSEGHSSHSSFLPFKFQPEHSIDGQLTTSGQETNLHILERCKLYINGLQPLTIHWQNSHNHASPTSSLFSL